MTSINSLISLDKRHQKTLQKDEGQRLGWVPTTAVMCPTNWVTGKRALKGQR